MSFFDRNRRAIAALRKGAHPSSEVDQFIRLEHARRAELAQEDERQAFLAENVRPFDEELALRSLEGTPEPEPIRASAFEIDLGASSLGVTDTRVPVRRAPSAAPVKKIETSLSDKIRADFDEMKSLVREVVKAEAERRAIAKADTSRKVTVQANELKDVRVQFISLVKRGANRIPFRMVKADPNGVLDLSTLFRKVDAAPATKVDPPYLLGSDGKPLDLSGLFKKAK